LKELLKKFEETLQKDDEEDERVKELDVIIQNEGEEDEEEKIEPSSLSKESAEGVRAAHLGNKEIVTKVVTKEVIKKSTPMVAVQKIFVNAKGTLVLQRKHIYTFGSLLWIWLLLELFLLYFSISLSSEPELVWDGTT